MLREYVSVLALTTVFVIEVGTRIVYSAPTAQEERLDPADVPLLTIPSTPPTSSAEVKPSSTDLPHLIRYASHVCGVDPFLLRALIQRESSGRHTDSKGRVLRSSAGALGITQVLPSTAKDVDPNLNPRVLHDNLVLGACYLRQMLDRFVDPHRALVAYHRGPNAKGRTPKASHDYATTVLEWSTN